MKHVMNLQNDPFYMIKSGKKTIELRLLDDKRMLIAIGDEIKFLNANDSALTIECKVIALHKFSSFSELYDSLPLLKCGYTEDNVSFASPSDMELYYSKEEQSKYGVVGIEIEVHR